MSDWKLLNVSSAGVQTYMRQDEKGNVEFLHSDPNVNAVIENNKGHVYPQ